MGYAVKKDKSSYRSIDDKSWCDATEFYSATEPTDIQSPSISVEVLRRIAYADPVNGSDWYLAKAASLVAAGADPTSDAVKALQAKSIEVKESIKKMFPYPTES